MTVRPWSFSIVTLALSVLVGVMPAAPLGAAEPATELDAETLYDILLGELAAQRGQMDIAADSLRRAAQRSRDPRFAERATLAAISAKQYQNAYDSAKLWAELQPANQEAHEAMALALLELDRVPEARDQLALLLDTEKVTANLESMYLRIAGVLGRVSNRQAALTLMQDLVKRRPDIAAGHFAHAHLAVRAGDLEVAETAVNRSLEIKPDWQDAALFKARILISRDQAVEAQRYFEQYLKGHPNATHVRLSYARYLVDQKQWEQAREQFKRVVAETPDDAEAIYAVGLLALQTNRLDEAETALKRVIALRPDNDQARLYLGQVAEQAKRYPDAVRWYKDIEVGEFFIEAQTRLGMVVAKMGDLAKARSLLHAIPVENDQQRVQIALAEEQILRDARKYKDALEMLNEALKRLPGDRDLMYARALVAERLDMLALAESDLRTILKGDPKNVNALNALGYTLADRTNRYDEAQKLIKQALELKPDDPYVLDSMGWVMYRRGDSNEALKYLKRALTLRSDAEIAAHLGEVLWVSGDHGEAESVWTRALRDTPESEVLRDVIKKFKP
jgi:tetratricopeptide (TPR) repeat protein